MAAKFFLAILSKPFMSNINDCAKFEDNQSKHPRALKMGCGHLGNKMADVKTFFSQVVPLDPEMNTENLKMIS